MAEAENNYVVGRGKVFFDRFTEGTKTPTGQKYFGNSPEFGLDQSEENLDHYSADDGLKVKDDSVTLSQDTGFNLVVDNISADNLALWFLGDKSAVVVAGATNNTDSLTVLLGAYYQLGESAETPQGLGDLDNVSITGPRGVHATGTLTFSGTGTAADTITIDGNVITLVDSGAVGAQVNIGASATLTAQALLTYINANTATLGVTASGAAAALTIRANVGGTDGNAITTTEVGTGAAFAAATLTGGDPGAVAATGNWEIDLVRGRLYIDPAATSIADGDVLTVEYDNATQTISQVISSGRSIYGRLWFVSTNPKGTKRDAFFPYVKISPDGNYDLKGDDWQTLSFTGEILKLADRERVYWTTQA